MTTLSIVCASFFVTLDILSVFFIIVILTMLACIWGIHYYKKRIDIERERMRNFFVRLIQDAIWFEGFNSANDRIRIPDVYLNALKRVKYRRWIIQDMIRTKKNLSGVAATNLEKLYDQLELYKTSFHKVKMREWHLKAEGIQELYFMNNKRYISEILQLTKCGNEHVRAEAQIGMVCLNGFKGLIFLDDLALPISEWNQIRLLNRLAKEPFEFYSNISIWLKSANNSVVLFGLKFIEVFHLFDFQKEVEGCLSHNDDKVKMVVLEVLQAVYDEHTELLIRLHYASFEYLPLKLKAIETLGIIGTEKSLPFLKQEIKSKNKQIKLCAARAIVLLAKEGIRALEDILEVNEEATDIVQHLKFELQR